VSLVVDSTSVVKWVSRKPANHQAVDNLLIYNQRCIWRKINMITKDFAEYVKNKNFDEILHEGRRESADRILSEALVPLALLLSRELLKVLLLSPQVLEGLTTSPIEKMAS
jgi:hypothetical protein